MKKRRVKALLIALCVGVLAAGSAVTTIAYLTDKTEKAVNVFVLGELFEHENAFVLAEHAAQDPDRDGVYALDLSSEVSANTYLVMPGVDLPKDPFVRSEEALKSDAYLFVALHNTLDPAVFTVTVDSANWADTGLVNEDGDKVYVLAKNGGIAPAGEAIAPIYILKDNTIEVAGKTVAAEAGVSDELTFKAYIIQAASFADAASAATVGLGFTAAP